MLVSYLRCSPRSQDCIRILKNVRPALSAPGARLLIVEHVLPIAPYVRFPTGYPEAVSLPLVSGSPAHLMHVPMPPPTLVLGNGC